MKTVNKNNKKSERVEVMALFNYSRTPCQPLSFKERSGREVEITELIHSQVKFIGATAKHVFDCLAGNRSYQLEFDSTSLVWHLLS